MIRVAIVEDDQTYAGQFRGFVERFCAENQIEMGLTHFFDGMQITEDYRPVWDLILMDIKMPHMDGMSAARRIAANGGYHT